jgi:hypothetical protein
MPTYRINDPSTGKTIRLVGDSPPTEQELEEIFKSVGQQQPSAPATIADMRRREEQGMVAALPPEQVQSQEKEYFGQLQEAVDQSNKIGQRQLATGAFMPSYTQEERQKLGDDISNLTATVGRVAPVIAGAALTGGASIPVMMAAGAASGAVGEGIGQTLEKMFGRRENYSLKQIIAAGVGGAAPVVPGAGILKSIGNVASQASGGMLAKAIETEGTNVLSGATIPALISTGTQIASGVAGRFGGAFGRAAERAQDIEKIGVEPTFGQTMPGFAGMEARVTSRAGGEKLRTILSQQDEQISNAVSKITGIESQGADNVVRRLLEDLGAEEARTIANASSNLENANSILEKVRGTAQEQAASNAIIEAQNAFEDSIQKTLLAGTKPGQFRSISAGNQIDRVVLQARNSIRLKARELYGPANDLINKSVFDLTVPSSKEGVSFADAAQALFDTVPEIHSAGISGSKKLLNRKVISGGRDPLLGTDISTIKNASLFDLNKIKDELYDFADYAGEAIGKAKQNQVRDLANILRETVYQQAPLKLGEKAAKAIFKGDDFYAESRSLLDLYGVKSSFKPKTMEKGQAGEQLVEKVSSQGLDTPAYKNLEKLTQKLKSLNAPSVPELSDVTFTLRKGIVDDAFDKTLKQFDYKKLADTLNEIESQSPGALKKLGFGSKDQLDKFISFTGKLKSQPGPEQLIEILNSNTPAGFAIGSESVRNLENFLDRKSVISHLEKLSQTNPHAKTGLMSLRASEIERLLLEASGPGRGPRVDILSELSVPKIADEYKSILGDKFFELIKNDFVPGFKRILDYRIATGQTGTTLRGQAGEQAAIGMVKGIGKSVTGKPAEGFFELIGDLVNLGMYSTASKIISRTGGSAGYKSSADFMRNIEKLGEKLGSSQNINAIQRYADTGEIP